VRHRGSEVRDERKQPMFKPFVRFPLLSADKGRLCFVLE
jgi:hypothetical protein